MSRAATSRERSLASGIRARLDDPTSRAKVSAEQRRWLASYDDARKNTGTRTRMLRLREEKLEPRELERAPVLEQPAPAPATAPSSEPMVRLKLEDEPAPVDVDEGDDEDDEDDEDAGGDELATRSETRSETCDIFGCSCKRGQNPTCRRTGNPAYPPVSSEGGAMLASFTLGGVHGGVRFAGWLANKPGKPPRPTREERDRLGAAIQKTCERRFPQVGAIDDLLQLSIALGAYATRAMGETMAGAGISPPVRPALRAGNGASSHVGDVEAARQVREEQRVEASRPVERVEPTTVDDEEPAELSDDAIDRELAQYGVRRASA